MTEQPDTTTTVDEPDESYLLTEARRVMERWKLNKAINDALWPRPEAASD